LAVIDSYESRYPVANVNAAVARSYGVIRNELRQKGKPIPSNDVWIAAIAISFGYVLVTRDAHFREVPNLTLETW